MRALLLNLARRIPRPLRQDLLARGLRLRARWRARGLAPEAAPTPVRQDCRYCGVAAGSHHRLGQVTATHPGPFRRNDYALVHCDHCEVVYLEPLPGADDLATLYGASQFSDPLYSDPGKAARILDYYVGRVRDLQLAPGPGEHCLEVGAGLAWLSRAIKAGDPQVHTWAQDISSECVADCPWVDRYQVGALEALPPLPPMRLICLTHVIEHVPDPNALLQQLADRLGAGGKLFLTAPYRPPGWRLADGIGPWRDYGYLHVPAHIAYLSRSWLEAAAARVGLVLVHWEQSHDGHQALEAVLHKPIAGAPR